MTIPETDNIKRADIRASDAKQRLLDALVILAAASGREEKPDGSGIREPGGARGMGKRKAGHD